MKGDERVLVARVREELKELEDIVSRAERLMAKARERGDEDYLDGVALNLQSFYTGVERIFESIARDIDTSIPSGPEWHRDLLLQLSTELPGTRPAMIGRSLRNCLDEFRGFRHVVRNVYTFNLIPSRLQELVSVLRPCYQSLVDDVEAFCDFLVQLGEDCSS
ncbi:MAG TPA: hypothetical protein DCE18_01715 [Syntrophobacteraceae bacterium]|jgi:hypothetical protein|nr:hypothetical protein [Syntrophobacteraceae bacterium]